ncbi:LysR family transcriptional regulator [Paenibacillus ginsengarvi]|uniref:LysR family transcriptional regulator n=1 Tax=Paenibacillus ginsengarvi TaxID=400777 RepID=A0A3B0BD55_9BACL|nr:LysR family transcriptional regulator [Paenibacillus ginsengarvi]RKN70690.1 LysR family transcriptional regulator [Paenibacillus ginsengarvi]
MEWQQLEYFQVVAEEEHFTRAAQLLSIAQPTLSRSIAKLEEELGVPLFDRQGRHVKLNRYGQLFYRRATRILREMTDAKREIADMQNPEQGSVSLAFLKSLGLSSVPELLRQFRRRYPYVTFQLHQNSTNAMLDQLEAGEIDYGLASITEMRPGIEWQQLWSEDIYVYVPNDHILADRSSVRLDELAHESFVILKQGYGARTVFDEACRKAGIAPHIAFESDEAVSAIGFVKAGLGITMLPAISGIDMTLLVRLPVSEPACRRTIGLAWNSHHYLDPTARLFRQFVSDYYDRHPGH